MNDLSPENSSPDYDLDTDLVLNFFDRYQKLEQALVRAGFTRADRRPGNTRADWARFARHIADKFDPDASPELTGAVCTLLADPTNTELCRKRRQGAYLLEPFLPERNTVWLAELVQQLRIQLLLRVNSVEVPVCDNASIMSALVVLEAWSTIDAKVQSLLLQIEQPAFRNGPWRT